MKKEGELARIEQDFFSTLVELNYISRNRKLNDVVARAASFARQLPAYNQWPHDAKQFWNAEALCWKGRVEKEVREAIKKELSFLSGYNLDLGSGSYSYVPNSVAADSSEEMLLLNDAEEKVVADLEKPLPFADQLFDSVTMIFLANYIKNVEQLLAEAKRVLKAGGKLAIVQSRDPVMELHRMHYKNSYSEPELKILLKGKGFAVNSYTKDVQGRKLLFVMGERGFQ